MHKDKLDGDTTTYYQQNTNLFTTDALCKKEKIIKEFNGCKWHGCPKCNPECKAKYNRNMERKNILELAGLALLFQCLRETYTGIGRFGCVFSYLSESYIRI